MPQPERVSPTAFATGMVWERAGLSPPGWVPEAGHAVDRLFQRFASTVQMGTGFSFNSWLLARHRAIDDAVEQAVKDGHVHTVIELAAGFSGRGLRLCERHPGLRYIETDLPHMVRLKGARFRALAHPPAGLRALTVDVSRTDGKGSLPQLLSSLPAEQGVAIITEGLMNYLPGPLADTLWRQIASGLQRFDVGLYVSDCYFPRQAHPAMALLGVALMGFTRRRLHSHLWSPKGARRRLLAAGFSDVRVSDCRDHAVSERPMDQRAARAVSQLTAFI